MTEYDELLLYIHIDLTTALRPVLYIPNLQFTLDKNAKGGFSFYSAAITHCTKNTGMAEYDEL